MENQIKKNNAPPPRQRENNPLTNNMVSIDNNSIPDEDELELALKMSLMGNSTNIPEDIIMSDIDPNQDEIHAAIFKSLDDTDNSYHQIIPSFADNNGFSNNNTHSLEPEYPIIEPTGEDEVERAILLSIKEHERLERLNQIKTQDELYDESLKNDQEKERKKAEEIYNQEKKK